MTDGTLSYAIELGTKGFLGPLSRATTGLARFTAKAVAVAAPIAAATAGAGALAVAMKSVNKAAEFEGLQVGIKNLLGSEKAAKGLLDQLQKFEAQTPFTLVSEIAPLARQLLNAKVAARDMLAEVTAIGNVAAGANVELGRLGAIYSKALNKGKVDGEIIMQLAEAGVPVFSMLAQTLGTTEDKIMDLASSGRIGAEVLRKAFQDLGGATGAWGKMMEEQSQTWNGLVSTLKGNVDQLMIAFGQPVMNGLKPMLQEAIQLVQGLKPQAEALGQTIGKGLMIGFEALKQGYLDDILITSVKIAGMEFANWMAEGGNRLMAKIPLISGEMGTMMEGVTKIFEAGLLRASVAFVNLLGNNLSRTLADMVSVMPGGKSMATAIRAINTANAFQNAAASNSAEVEAEGKGILKKSIDAISEAIASGEAFSDAEIDRERFKQAVLLEEVNKALREQKTQIESSTEAATHSAETQKRFDDAVEKSKQAIGGLESASTALVSSGAMGSGSGDPGSRRIKLYDLEESAERRAKRVSAYDQRPSELDTFLRGTKGNGNFITDISQSDLLERKMGPSGLNKPATGWALDKGSRAAGEAVATTVNPNSRALGNSRRRQQEQASQGPNLVAILQQIAANTQPLRQLGVAS